MALGAATALMRELAARIGVRLRAIGVRQVRSESPLSCFRLQ